MVEAERVEVGVLVAIAQQTLEEVADDHGAVDVEKNGHVAEEDHQNVQDVPETLEVLQAVLLDLQELFDGVVHHEEDEDPLARHHKVVEGGHVTDQLHCAEVERRDAAAGGRVLKQEPGNDTE